MRRAIRGVFLLSIVGVLGLILGRSVAAPPTTQEVERQKEIDSGVDRIVEKTDFQDTPLKEVVASLQKQTEANIVVNWAALEAAGIDQNIPITLKLGRLPLGRVLEVVGNLAGAGTVKMAYKVDRGVITFSTAEDLDREGGELRMYDVRDLVAAEMKRQARPSDSSGATTQPNICFGSGALNADGYEVAIDSLVRIIQNSVAPDSWRDAGGTIGSIMGFDGRLLITQTPENHTKVVKLLEMIRKG